MGSIPIKSTNIQEISEVHVSDINIIETQVREIQAERYYGEITFGFTNGILKPICNKTGTKEIKKQ